MRPIRSEDDLWSKVTEQTMELKQKVLVVDDERCLRKFSKTLLEVDGYHVDTESSGKEAIARINKGERPDFIILDVMMAEMSGFEALHELMRLDRSLNVIMTLLEVAQHDCGSFSIRSARLPSHPFRESGTRCDAQGEAPE